MRKTQRSLVCVSLATVVLYGAAAVFARGGGGHGGGSAHASFGGYHGGFSGGTHFGGYSGGMAIRSPGSWRPSGSFSAETGIAAGRTGGWQHTGDWQHSGNWQHAGDWQRSGFRHEGEFARAESWNRPYGWNSWGNRYAARWPYYTNWYHGNWYDHGHRWWWYGGPVGWWGGWGPDWGVGYYATPWTWGYFPYANPYCDSSVGTTVYDYSQPLIGTTDLAADSDVLTAPEQQGMQLLNAAKDAFKQGDYQAALKQIDATVKLMPEGRVAHEFRSLVLFALGQYKESAAAIYAVLAAGPGWDWTTMSGLYPDVEVYTKQLRALEQYAGEHSQASDAYFLLAYHYMVDGHDDVAAEQFRRAAKLNPANRLAMQIADAISHSGTAGDSAARATQADSAAPAKPVAAASLVGEWTAKRDDGAAIRLSLTADSKFTWKIATEEKPREFTGAYAVTDNLLVLKQGDRPMMVGQVRLLEGGGFNFRIVGANPGDPGLTFEK